MKRSMMQASVTRSDEAVALYQEAFDAVLISGYPNEDGTFFHSELDIQGEILAVA
jgi:PhnB protein